MQTHNDPLHTHNVVSGGRHPKKPIATAHEFTFVVDHRLSDDELDRLFDSIDDVTPEREHARTLLGFDRVAESLAAALVSALRDVEAEGLSVGSVRSEDLVTLKEIAARTGRTYESVRLLSLGRRGPGGFPGPMSSDGWTLYSWAQVRQWMARHYPSADLDRELLTLEHDRLIAAADHLVRARALLGGADLAADLAALVAA